MGETESDKLVIYEVTNKTTGEKSFQPATNAQDACMQAGWVIGDCYVNPQKPHYKAQQRGDPLLMVQIPCLTCPFQYGVCNRRGNQECPVKPGAPDLKEWLKQASEAHLCPYQGQELTKKDHDLGRKMVTVAQAIKELSPQP